MLQVAVTVVVTVVVTTLCLLQSSPGFVTEVCVSLDTSAPGYL